MRHCLRHLDNQNFIVDARKAGASRQAPLSYKQLQEKIKYLIHKTGRDPLARLEEERVVGPLKRELNILSSLLNL